MMTMTMMAMMMMMTMIKLITFDDKSFIRIVFYTKYNIIRRQRGSVVRVGDLYAEDAGSNPLLGLLNEFVLGDPRDKTHHAL